MEELGITDLSEQYIDSVLIPKYKSVGIDVTNYSILSNEEIKSINARWGKKLAYGRKRDIWEITCKINN